MEKDIGKIEKKTVRNRERNTCLFLLFVHFRKPRSDDLLVALKIKTDEFKDELALSGDTAPPVRRKKSKKKASKSGEKATGEDASVPTMPSSSEN